MPEATPDWGRESRFYLPNEDAAMVRKALSLLESPVRRPVFVGGSGMVLLDALAELPDLESADFVDLAQFQVEYFHRLLDALGDAESPATLREWFAAEVYPDLVAHFLTRGQTFPLEKVMAALDNRFSVRLFFEDAAFQKARHTLPHIQIRQSDILGYLSSMKAEHDFVYLSNVPDYMPESDLDELFRICRAADAPVYLLLTSACTNPAQARHCWEKHGFSEHADSPVLSEQNRGLGSHTLDASWNRPGSIHLLIPTCN